MKTTGIVRKLNDNGRVVIPKEMRKQYGIESNDSMVEILFSDGGMLVRKYEPACFYCGSIENVGTLKDTKICNRCLEKLKG